jgi:hypothetical protein
MTTEPRAPDPYPNRSGTAGQTHHTNGPTISAGIGWTRFINDTSGHGVAIAGRNFDSFRQKEARSVGGPQ